ncbi:MAG: helix-turn-helix domain-containing protein [Acutalibacteraceae bacterium]|nr:helix-turn-helix domain-containing protein [Acutalibacteraceae bacterium]
MSIFRVEKNSNYTVISNYHLRDKNLSLRTIGLLSLILSLPDNWDYSQAGLAAICKDGEDSVRSGLKELEKYGYLERERERDENGRMKGVIYKIYEMPKEKRNEVSTQTYGPDNSSNKKSPRKAKPQSEEPELDEPQLDSPILENPILDNPTMDSPALGKQPQINKDIPSTDELNKDLNKINLSINQNDGLNDNVHREALREIIKENIGYDLFERKCETLNKQLESGELDLFDYENSSMTYDLQTVNQILDYMLDILLSLNTDPIKIGDELLSRNVVKARLRKVDFMKMKKVVFELNTNSSIKNPKKYAISMLYNA